MSSKHDGKSSSKKDGQQSSSLPENNQHPYVQMCKKLKRFEGAWKNQIDGFPKTKKQEESAKQVPRWSEKLKR